MPDLYTIKFTPQGLDYLRGVLDTRPHGEVRPFVDSIEIQRRQQDEQAQALTEPPQAGKVTPLRTRRGRPPAQAAANGHDETPLP